MDCHDETLTAYARTHTCTHGHAHTHRFGQSTAKYASFLIMLIIVGEYTFEGLTDSLWTWNNNGRTFETTDWSPFDELDEDEEEEAEDDDDDE